MLSQFHDELRGGSTLVLGGNGKRLRRRMRTKSEHDGYIFCCSCIVIDVLGWHFDINMELALNFEHANLENNDYSQLLRFIQQRKLSYQPFRFDDEHEIGEGMAFLKGSSTESRKGVVHWPAPPSEISDLLVAPESVGQFRYANDALRAIYDHFIVTLCDHLGTDIGRMDFAEFGCNTGYFPYSLSLRGARQAYGLDFTYNAEVFEFFNRILGTNATFLFSEWDSLRHRPQYHEVPQVDVCLSVAVLCHLADPLHHLTYLCSRARKAIFVWTPSHQVDDLYMSFGQPKLFANSLAWPVSFDNLVKPSRGLIELCLKESGFEDIRHVAPISTPFDEIDFWKHHTGIVAFRTSEAATVYTCGAVRRERPADVPITEPEPEPANVVEIAPAESAADISAGRPAGVPPEPPTLDARQHHESNLLRSGSCQER